MTTPTVVQCLIPLLLALPILFGEEDFAAWETGAGRKLLEFSELAAHHAKTVWGACIAGGAALFGFLARHGSLAAHDVDIIRKDPDLLAICLLVVTGIVALPLLYLGAVLLVRSFSRYLASKGVVLGLVGILEVVVQALK